MLPGVSAGRLDLIGRSISIGGMLLLLIGAVIAVATKPPLPAVLAMSALFLAILTVGQVYRTRAVRRSRDEAAAGYSTLLDVPGFDFRDSRTGELIRTKDESPLEEPSPSIYTMRMPSLPPLGSGKKKQDQENGSHTEPPLAL